MPKDVSQPELVPGVAPWWVSDELQMYPQAPTHGRHLVAERPAPPALLRLSRSRDEVAVRCELAGGVTEVEIELRERRLVVHGLREGQAFSRALEVPDGLDPAKQRVRFDTQSVTVFLPAAPESAWARLWRRLGVWWRGLFGG